MKVVLDTNVLIAAGLKGSFAETILQMANKNLLTLVTSEEILEELTRKLTDKFNWSRLDAQAFVDRVSGISQIVKITESVSVVKRDPQDNKILECALASKADLIVTADQDLIILKQFKGIGIVHPKTLSWTFPEYFKKAQ